MKKNKDNDTNKKNKKRDTGRTKEKFPVKTKQEETSKPNDDEGIGGAKIVYATEPTFSVLMVYAYGDFQTYRELSGRLFRNPRPSEFTANGLAAFGSGVEEIGQSVSLIWVNNSQPLETTLPVFVHEIVHLSQDILDHAGVKDESGELQAYTIERECKRVMREFFGMAIPEEDDKAIHAAKDAVGRNLSTSSNTPAESR